MASLECFHPARRTCEAPAGEPGGPFFAYFTRMPGVAPDSGESR